MAAPRGAAVEVVDDGVTGFLREEVDEMVAALRNIDSISPEACRSRVEKLFSAGRWPMATYRSGEEIAPIHAKSSSLLPPGASRRTRFEVMG
jgi:hypothetical protein